MASPGKVGIIGSGLIGKNWAMIFASAGYTVSLYDSDPAQLTKVLPDVRAALADFEKKGVLRGKIGREDQIKLISVTSDIKECLKV